MRDPALTDQPRGVGRIRKPKALASDRFTVYHHAVFLTARLSRHAFGNGGRRLSSGDGARVKVILLSRLAMVAKYSSFCGGWTGAWQNELESDWRNRSFLLGSQERHTTVAPRRHESADIEVD